MLKALIFGVFVHGAYGASLRSPRRGHLLGSSPGLGWAAVSDDSIDFNKEWKAPLIGQMEELESLLSRSAKEPTKFAVGAQPVLDGVAATLPWAQALMARRATKQQKRKSGDDQKALFKKFDVNKDGNLSVAETAAMAPTDKDRFCNAAVAVMCADADGGGSLDEKEFAATFKSTEFTACYLEFEPHCFGHTSDIKRPKFLNVSSNITAKFKSADSNKDGFLSVDEFSAVSKELNPNVTNPHCFADVAVRCADEDGSDSLDVVEFIDVLSPGTLMNEYTHCMNLNSPACNPTEKSDIPSHLSVPYSPERCTDLFAYKFERELCGRLQKKVCGFDCKTRYNITSKGCGEMQQLLCKVPKAFPDPKPLRSGGRVPNNSLKTNVTVCIAFPTRGASAVWVSREGYGFPKPLATKLSYLDCAQIMAFRGMEIGVYLGANKVASHTCQERNELVMVGVSLKDTSRKAVTSYSFHDEQMRRPILCHAAPFVPTMTVSVYTRTWHAFANTKNLDGELSYLQCEVLNQDHDDLLKHHEWLQFSKGNTIQGHIEITPLPTLYLLRSGRESTLRTKAHILGHLKYE